MAAPWPTLLLRWIARSACSPGALGGGGPSLVRLHPARRDGAYGALLVPGESEFQRPILKPLAHVRCRPKREARGSRERAGVRRRHVGKSKTVRRPSRTPSRADDLECSRLAITAQTTTLQLFRSSAATRRSPTIQTLVIRPIVSPSRRLPVDIEHQERLLNHPGHGCPTCSPSGLLPTFEVSSMFELTDPLVHRSESTQLTRDP